MKWSREHTVLMYSTAYNLWRFTWFVHFKLPFRLKGTEKIHTEGLFKFQSNIYSILYACTYLAFILPYSCTLQSLLLTAFYLYDKIDGILSFLYTILLKFLICISICILVCTHLVFYHNIPGFLIPAVFPVLYYIPTQL